MFVGYLVWCCLLPLVLGAFVVAWFNFPRLRHAIGFVSLLVVVPAVVSSATLLGIVLVTSETLQDRDLIDAECGGPESIIDRRGRRTGTPHVPFRGSITVRLAEIEGLPVRPSLEREGFHRMDPFAEPDPDAVERERLDATFPILLFHVGERAITTYSLHPYDDRGHNVFVALASDPHDADLEVVLGPSIERHLEADVVWWHVMRDALALHTERDGGTLELFAVDLSLRVRATGLGRLLDPSSGLLDDGSGGAFAVSAPAVGGPGEARDPSIPITVFHVRADGTTTRSDVHLPLRDWSSISEARTGGLCVRGNRAVHIAGEPLATARWGVELVLADHWNALLALAIALVAAGGSLAVLLPPLRAWSRVSRRGTPGELRHVDGLARWVGPDGIERTLGDVGEWIGFDEESPKAGFAVAVDLLIEGATGDLYRGARGPIRARTIVAGSLVEARALLLRPVLHASALIGAGLVLIALPAVLFVLSSL